MKVYCRDKAANGKMAMFQVSEELTIREAIDLVKKEMKTHIAFVVIK